MARAEAYPHAKFRLDPFNRLTSVHQRHRQTGHTGQTGQTDRQRTDSIGRTVLQTVAQKPTHIDGKRTDFMLFGCITVLSYQLPLSCYVLQRELLFRWLRPSIPPELLNRYAYRPTGSTAAALVHVFHSLTRMLEDSAYVGVILIDSDIADHTVLMSKLAELQLPGNIYIIG